MNAHNDLMTSAPQIAHHRLHQATFLAAGIYNIAWGAFSAVRPQWLFDWADMAPANHPEIFACLGMVLALYGILYLGVSHAPATGGLVATVGLLGKLLGPAGWVYLYTTGIWPLETVVLILTNDLIWWLPFAWYLHDLKAAGSAANRPAPRPSGSPPQPSGPPPQPPTTTYSI